MNPLKQVRFALAVLLMPNTVGVVSAAGPSNATEEAIAWIARRTTIVSIFDLAAVLDLPELPKQLVWRGPTAGHQSADFFADYKPLESSLGIKGVVIGWQIGQGKVFHSLGLAFDGTACPTDKSLEAAIGASATKTMGQGVDGAPPYPLTYWLVPRPDGEPVHINYTGPNACNIYISRSRPL